MNWRAGVRSAFCCLLCLLLFGTLLPLSALAAEETPKTVRVGWYEDSYHITGANGERTGYAYEYEQAVAAYTGWTYEYVKGDWSELLQMLQNGEIDLMAALSYTDERAETMLFSDLPMGEEKYYLYADLSDGDISASDLTTLNGKRILAMADSVQDTQFSAWEESHQIKTQHIDVHSIDAARELIESGGADGVISTETPIWVEYGMSAIATTGGSGIYYGINKNRPDLKKELDNAMRSMENDKPFYADELYQNYLSSQSVAVLSGEEKEWLTQHGPIVIGCLKEDFGVSMYDPDSGAIAGIVADYVDYAADCLEEQALDFTVKSFDSQSELLQALKNGEVDMVFHAAQSPYAAEQNHLSLSNTVWTFTMAAITGQDRFDESAENTVAVVKDDLTLQWYLAYNYSQWKLLTYDNWEAAQEAVRSGEATCFVVRSSWVTDCTKGNDLHAVFLMQPDDVSFAVRRGDATLLSILNKTLKTMPSAMLTGALTTYDTAYRKVTASDFIRDNLAGVMVVVVSVFLVIFLVILMSLKRAKTSEETAKKAMQLAEEANAAKSNFLFNMSHDIRTPMSAILGFTALAEKTPDDPALVKSYLEKIQISGQGMLSILDNVLELSRIEAGKTTLEEAPQEAGTVFDTCIIMMSPEIEKKHHTVTVEKKVDTPYVFCDATRVTEIAMNILSNAIKYTANGGRIACTMAQSPHPDEGWVYEELSVADTGIGMSEEFQQHIFDTFSRERSTTLSGIQGTGLGMGIVKKLVDLMGGTVTVQSKLGKGTTVQVKLPMRIATQEECQPKHSATPSEKKALHGKRILLAEDNDLNAEIATALLEEEGLLVDRAADGVQCVEKLEHAAPGYYALILMDVQMPVLDGYQATARIRKLSEKAKAEIPIIAMTANAFSEDRAQALAVGMNDHVSKPINMNILTEVLVKYMLHET